MSRKKRKRYRRALKQRELAAEASAKSRPPVGGWGEGVELTRGDWALVRRAANQDWDVPMPVRRSIMSHVGAHLETDDCPPRLCISIARTVVAMDSANLRMEKLARRILLK